MTEMIIVSGISGAGKSQALHAFEDLGYYCVDNVLPQLIMEIARTLGVGSMQEFDKVALVVDIRGGEFFKGIYSILDLLKINGINYKLLFLDARDDVLSNRYKETRRSHPLSRDGMVSEGIAKERAMTAALKAQADKVIDTSDMPVKELKQSIYTQFSAEAQADSPVRLISFGFKRGIPYDCDFVYDCRFLPNPHNVESLRPFNGTDKRVAEYVAAHFAFNDFVGNITGMIRLALPDYLTEVKPMMVVGLGCTGGKHRSVATACRVARLLAQSGVNAALKHRDIYID